MKLYCTECGSHLPIIRKAMPKYSCIVDMIEPHVCLDKPIEIDLKPAPSVEFIKQVRGKFVEKLNELQPPSPLASLSTGDLRDRRSVADVRADSTAPANLLRQMKELSGTPPVHDLKDPGDEDD